MCVHSSIPFYNTFLSPENLMKHSTYSIILLPLLNQAKLLKVLFYQSLLSLECSLSHGKLNPNSILMLVCYCHSTDVSDKHF